MLFVDVKLGPSEKDLQRLELFPGDDPAIISLQFSTKHGLSIQKQTQMEHMLRMKLQEVQ
jgi:hypothetical protein